MGKEVALLLGMLIMIMSHPGKAQAAELRAAAGQVDITPTKSVYIAGYGSNRKSVGVHDKLMAKCLVLESGGTRIAFVACDLLGIPRFQIEKIRAKVKAIKPEHLFIAATHVHSGPDTFGMWGPDLQTSGVDQEWMASLLEKIAKLVEATAPKLQPAVLKFANTTDVPRISRNARVEKILDKELGVMQVLHRDTKKAIATFVNYACHPEVLNNKQITADFPHWLYETVEQKTGGLCLYLNGALGGMVTADFDETVGPKNENWQAAEEIGTNMGNRVLEILEKAEIVRDVPIITQRRVFQVPMENERFKALIALRVFPGEIMKNGNVETEVNRLRIGPAEMLTLPGEVLPNIGFYLKRKMKGHPKFLLGLTCDELGYILTPEDYGLELYSYETSVSIGEQMGSRMVDNLLAMISEGRRTTNDQRPTAKKKASAKR